MVDVDAMAFKVRREEDKIAQNDTWTPGEVVEFDAEGGRVKVHIRQSANVRQSSTYQTVKHIEDSQGQIPTLTYRLG